MVNGIPLARQEMFVRVCIMNPIMYELPSTDYVCNYHYPYFLFNKITFFKRWHPVVCLTIGVWYAVDMIYYVTYEWGT
jgi:hypothetical protein